MDKSIFKQLDALLAESEAEEMRIVKLQSEIDVMKPKIKAVTDIVTRGRRGKKPLGICVVRGFEDHRNLYRKCNSLRKRKAKKELHLTQIDDMIIEAEEYIYSINDSELRNILMCHCIDKKGWGDVARVMGEGYTAESCKQKFSRFMRQK